MKKKLFYVVEKELADVGHVEETTGNKTITLYEIIDNTPKQFATIEGVNDDRTGKLIEEYLDDNGFGDESFELHQL